MNISRRVVRIGLNVTIPTLGKPKTVKDAIVSILSKEWPLTARRIYIKVKSLDLDVTYQAVHKALNELVTEEITKKEENKHKLSEAWIEKIKEFGIKIDLLYKGEMKGSLENVISTGYGIFGFVTVLDLYRFILEMIIFFEEFYERPKYPGVVCFSHMWWALLGSEKEQEQFKKAASWKTGVFFACSGETGADKMLARFYESVKGTNVRVKVGVYCPNEYEMFIVEDYLVHIYLPEEIKKIFDSTYRNFKLGSSSDFQKLYENILFKKTEINVTIQRNPKLAEMIRSKVLGHFRK